MSPRAQDTARHNFSYLFPRLLHYRLLAPCFACGHFFMNRLLSYWTCQDVITKGKAPRQVPPLCVLLRSCGGACLCYGNPYLMNRCTATTMHSPCSMLIQLETTPTLFLHCKTKGALGSSPVKSSWFCQWQSQTFFLRGGHSVRSSLTQGWQWVTAWLGLLLKVLL